MIPKKPRSFDELSQLCNTYGDLELFLWLQRKFPPGNLMETHTATVLKEDAIRLIAETLKTVSLEPNLRLF